MSLDLSEWRAGGEDFGQPMIQLIRRLFPICRSITGDGVRETLAAVGEFLPLTLHEVPTGTRVFDWTIPKEWNIRGATLKTIEGKTVVDFQDHNLHVVSYSVPIETRMDLQSLQPHLHSLPEQPNLIPYRTSYYQEDWGFCLSHRQREALPDTLYDVRIDSRLEDGSLTYGEVLLPGAAEEEFVVFTHVCHPSLANDNLSGIALTTFLARILGPLPTHYSYRFVFAPGTIGAITWLARNTDRLKKVVGGLTIVLVGDAGHLRYKRTRSEKSRIDDCALYYLQTSDVDFDIEAFSPFGYDERQFASPGIDLPVGRLTRSPNGQYGEYHTSGDNLEFVHAQHLAQSLSAAAGIIEVFDNDRHFRNTAPFGEPQLGRRGLYRPTGGAPLPDEELAMLWVLNQSDGTHSLLDIAKRSGLSFSTLMTVSRRLEQAGLLESVVP